MAAAFDSIQSILMERGSEVWDRRIICCGFATQRPTFATCGRFVVGRRSVPPHSRVRDWVNVGILAHEPNFAPPRHQGSNRGMTIVLPALTPGPRQRRRFQMLQPAIHLQAKQCQTMRLLAPRQAALFRLRPARVTNWTCSVT